MTAKEYVQQVKKIETLIKNQKLEIKQAERLSINTSYLQNSIKQLEKTRQEIISNIERLTEPEYDVLHRVYVQGQTFYEVASERDITYRCVTSIHGRALKRLETFLKTE